MCEECKSSQWSKNWPYLWLMEWLISSGIFINMPVYWLLYSAFVIIMLSTFGDDKKKKKQPFLTFTNEKTNSISEYTRILLLALFTFVHVPTRWWKLAFKRDTAHYYFFLHIKIESQSLTDCTHWWTVWIYHNQLRYYARHIVHTLEQQR